MIRSLLDECRSAPARAAAASSRALVAGDAERGGAVDHAARVAPARTTRRGRALARGARGAPHAAARRPWSASPGTGGAGKSSVVDELVLRLRRERPDASVGAAAGRPDAPAHRRRAARRPDPHERDPRPARLRALLATRRAHLALSRTVGDALRVLQAADFDLVIVETAGIGQSDSEIVDLVDTSVYVMTPEYGAPSQLEKIDMLDLADFVVLNKSDRQRRARRAARRAQAVAAQPRAARGRPTPTCRCSPTIARQWNDPGVDRAVRGAARRGSAWRRRPSATRAASRGRRAARSRPRARALPRRDRRDACAAGTRETERLAERAADAAALERAQAALAPDARGRAARCARRATRALAELGPELARGAARAGPSCARAMRAEQPVLRGARARDRRREPRRDALAARGSRRSRCRARATGASSRASCAARTCPGSFPFTAGVFPFKREDEDPTRMFAGEGTPERTNRRFHLLSRGQPAARLSTAFDSVTLYGRDPDARPDIYGKVGNSGVSVCTVDDAEEALLGLRPRARRRTSVSMTINGPAPTVLAFFLNAAIDQGVEQHLRETGRLEAVRAQLAARDLPRYAGAAARGPRRARPRAARRLGRRGGRRRDLRADPRRRAARACAAPCRPTS